MSRLTRAFRVLALGIPLLSGRVWAQAADTADDVADEEAAEEEEVDGEAQPDGKPAPGDTPAGEGKAPAEDAGTAPGRAEEDAADAADAEAAEEDEALEEEEGENPSRPPAPGKSVIWGEIKDTEFSEPLVELLVQVLGSKTQAITDENGKFRLELPPGTYSLRFSYELHKAQRVDGVIVRPGQVLRMDIQMVPDEAATEEFEIVEEADKESLEGIILARQRATIVGDSIGRGEISKSTDRNAAQAAQRVVGATVVGGRFVYVRGLGERYTNALINGVPLPSPEPDRAAVPLDLFPTGVLNSLTIAKTFTPDVPGDFAGGSVRIETREIPNEFVLQVTARGGYNTNSTFRERLSSRGGDLDWLGIDDGTRALPDGFPKEPIGAAGVSRRDAGLQLNSYMSAQRSGTPPDHGISVVAGNGWDLGENRKFGFVGSLGYGRSYTVRRNETLRLFTGDAADPRGFSARTDYRATTGNENVNWGGFGSATYRFSPHHRISLLGMRSTLADNRTRFVTGFHQGRSANIQNTQLVFISRSLNLAMLSGEHLFQALGSAELEWNLVLSSASRDEPDRRDSVWSQGSNPVYRFTEVPESGRHFFSEQVENQYGGGADWTQPIGISESKLKFGALASLRDRDFTSRNLRFDPLQSASRNEVLTCPSVDFDACNDALFVPENIGPVLELIEETRPTDSYKAKLNVYAGYVMAELGLSKQVRVVIGERIEHTYQTIDPYDQFGLVEDLENARIRQTDLLPAVSGTWSPTKKTKVRASVTRTLARPQLRELAPFSFTDYFGGRVTAGNPDLKLTRITNVDTRLEHFPTLKDVLAFSLFYKDFKDPIEPVIISSGDENALTFQNAFGASLIGIELEARRGLGAFADALSNFSVVTNLTLAQSRIKLPRGGATALTNISRPLVNQAPWVFNISLDYSREDLGLSGRVLYNVVGPRITQIGTAGLDDVYEHPRGIADFTVQKKFGEHMNVKFEARNLLNSEVLQTQGCGSDGLFGSTWHLGCSKGKADAVVRYTEGVSLALAAGYDF